MVPRPGIAAARTKARRRQRRRSPSAKAAPRLGASFQVPPVRSSQMTQSAEREIERLEPDPVVLAAIRERGFALVAGMVDAETASRMRRDLQRAIDEDLAAWEGLDYPDAWMVHNLMIR